MLNLEVISEQAQHILVSADTPGRFEISVINGKIMLHAYHGSYPEPDQDPVFAFDGNEGGNEDCESLSPEEQRENDVVEKCVDEAQGRQRVGFYKAGTY